jgi:AraC-like DNA-binding protein
MLPLDAVCQTVNLSKSRIRHLFKWSSARPFGNYVRQKQMEHARTLLESSFLNVKQVMARAGFNDESHFTRDFKRVYGCSPTRYRVDYWKQTEAAHDS